jgi:D-cysteine desulfhydrase
MMRAMALAPRRLDVARLPTPIVPLQRTSAQLGGPALWMKRDDLTGSVLSGNKIRKLQYAVAQAQDEGCDVLVTCGGLQSNHCRATAALARIVGLDVVLVLRGEEPPRLEGNFLLDRVFGAEIRFITPEQYADKDAVMADVAGELRARGRKPFVIAEGCSMPIGCWGYIEAAKEIADAQAELGVTFDAIVHAVGSGGTSAGLELGVRMHGVRADVWGINVCDDEDYFRDLVHEIIVKTREAWELDIPLDRGDIGLIDGHVGDGYGKTRPDELQTLVDLARREGVVLDPVYGGKAFHGLLRELADGRFADARNILFIHTGGIFGLQPYADSLPR